MLVDVFLAHGTLLGRRAEQPPVDARDVEAMAARQNAHRLLQCKVFEAQRTCRTSLAPAQLGDALHEFVPFERRRRLVSGGGAAAHAHLACFLPESDQSRR